MKRWRSIWRPGCSRATATSAVAQQTSKGAAQETTQACDMAMQALYRWMQDFLAIARIALAEQPQRLEQLGVRVAA